MSKKHKSPLDIANLMGEAAHKKSRSMEKKDAIDSGDEEAIEAGPAVSKAKAKAPVPPMKEKKK